MVAASKAARPSVAAVSDVVVNLQRDFAVEALRIVAIKASHCADDIAIGDDTGAQRNLRIAIAHLREGARGFRELLDGREPPKGGP